MKTIGFIGLGNAGGPLARRLLDKGFPLKVYDLNRERMRPLAQRGAAEAASPRETAAEVTISVLPSDVEVESAAWGKDGILAGLKKDSLWMDFSGTGPECSRRVAKASVEKGARFVGGTVHAAGAPSVTIPEGQASLAVGGSPEDIEEATEILQTMSRKIIVLPEAWMPKSLKLAVIMLSMARTTAAAEVTSWLHAQGLDPRLLLKLLQETGSRASASTMQQFFRRHVNRGGMLRNSKKDLRQALRLAHSLNLPLPLTALIEQIQLMATAEGLERVNSPAAFGRIYEKMTGLDIGTARSADAERESVREAQGPKLVKVEIT